MIGDASTHRDLAYVQENVVSPWFLAYTKPKQEKVAQYNLEAQAYQTYLPLFKVLNRSSLTETSSGQAFVYEPMFPRYVFFRPSSPSQAITAVRSTRGVASIVSFGFEYAAVQVNTLDVIRNFESQRNQASAEALNPIKAGQMVRLQAIELQGFQGLVQSISGKRVAILLDILGRQKLVTVKNDQIEMV